MVKPIGYELIRCEINGQRLFFNGIKIDTKQDIKRITHSASYDPIGYVTGEKTVDFSLTDPKDAQMITILYDTWVQFHTHFNMQLFSQNVDTLAWDMVGALEGCVLNKVDHNLKAKEEWKPSVSGMALNYRSIRHQFDPATEGLLDSAKDVLASANTLTAKATGIVSGAETAKKLIRL
jgi:hypothetical protein